MVMHMLLDRGRLRLWEHPYGRRCQRRRGYLPRRDRVPAVHTDSHQRPHADRRYPKHHGPHDQDQVERLRRRVGSLRRQIAEASELIAPQRERELNGVEAASRHAHDVFVQVTRERLAEARAGRPVVRPFAGRGGAAVRSEPVTCPTCLEMGASEAESFEIHHSDADGRPLAVPEAELAESGGQDAGRGERWPARYDGMGREIIRTVGYSDDGRLGNYSPVAYR